MTLTTVLVGKNLPLHRHEAEEAIEGAAKEARSRFATPEKHTIYDRKLREATRYLDAVASGNTPPNLNGYPYMKKEVGPGKTAATALELANLWVAMNSAWEDVSATIEDISLSAKAAARASNDPAEIKTITAAAAASLDAIGTKPPQRPNKPFRR